MIVARTPMGRLGEPRDVGDLVALLCGDGARWLTGQRLEVAGGFTCEAPCRHLRLGSSSASDRVGLSSGRRQSIGPA